jgi:hypothetical protein
VRPGAAVATALAVFAAGPAVAQSRLAVTAAAEGAFVRARSTALGGAELLSGSAFGGEALLSRGGGGARWRLRLGYAQGHLTADSGTAAPRDLSEGRAQVGLAAAPWLVLWAGPRARSYATAAGRQRWWFWELAAEARGTLFVDRAYALGALTLAPAGNVDALPSFSREAGLVTGLAVRLTRSGREVWSRLAYRVDQTRLAGGRRETVEALSLAVSVNVR